MLIILFLVLHIKFLFVPCGRLSWLPVSFLLHVKYTLSYRIVSYRMASGADLQASERYDGAQPCSDLNISVASLNFEVDTASDWQPVQFLQNR